MSVGCFKMLWVEDSCLTMVLFLTNLSYGYYRGATEYHESQCRDRSRPVLSDNDMMKRQVSTCNYRYPVKKVALSMVAFTICASILF